MDEIDTRFHEYANPFLQIYAKLIKVDAPNIVGKTNLRERLKAGIKNDQVINHWAMTICGPDVAVQSTFKQNFCPCLRLS